jgi:uncharacterized protein YjbJ (UPF0337 family)
LKTGSIVRCEGTLQDSFANEATISLLVRFSFLSDSMAAPLLFPDDKVEYFTHEGTPDLGRQGRRTVNKDQVSGKVEQAVGKVKQSVGEAVGSEKLANQGVVDQAEGAAKETWGNAKDAAKEVRQSRKNAATDKAHERRNKISQSVQNAKEKAKEKIDEFKDRHSA